MRKAIIACLAFGFLVSPLHAEDKKPGSGFLTGAAKGAGAGGTGTDTQNCNTLSSSCKTHGQISNTYTGNQRSIKPTTTKPITSGSSQQTGRK
jgi:hypothetical protein